MASRHSPPSIEHALSKRARAPAADGHNYRTPTPTPRSRDNSVLPPAETPAPARHAQLRGVDRALETPVPEDPID
eukprot:15368887-Alexandrium_andersonii.AAC.1